MGRCMQGEQAVASPSLSDNNSSKIQLRGFGRKEVTGTAGDLQLSCPAPCTMPDFGAQALSAHLQ